MVHKLATISETNEISRVESLMTTVLEPSGYLDMNWIEENNWVAVPVESASHFNSQDAERLVYAIKKEGIPQSFAIATEPLKNFPRCLIVPTTKEDFLTFSQECAHFNILIISLPLSFAVLCTVFDYYVISGTPAFVEDAAGCTIAEARSRFLEYASKSGQPDRLIAVARQYQRVSLS